MGHHDVSVLERRARQKYEAGRLRLGIVRSWPALVLSSAALLWCSDAMLCLCCGLLLFISTTAFLWRGQAWGQAVRPALLAGIAPAIAPLIGRAAEHAWPVAYCSTTCAFVCIVGGIMGGSLFGYHAARLETERLPYLLSGGIILAIAGSLGCLQMGTIGLWSMLGGLLIGGVPAIVLRSFART